MEPRLKGHRLFPENAVRVNGKYVAGTRGMAICQCGARSAELSGVFDRQKWHTQHIADVISGKARLL